jgi:hypothetical protein
MKTTVKVNWNTCHYCLGGSPNVELSRGCHLSWLITDLPDFSRIWLCAPNYLLIALMNSLKIRYSLQTKE